MAEIRVALVQFDAVPEQVDRNLRKMESLAQEAAAAGAQWVMFHEGTVCDYTPNPAALAEPVPAGRSTRFVESLARRLGCHISFGLSERDGERFFISQVFVGPAGFLYRYRKTWLWRQGDDDGYRNEWARYDPGTGPEIFEIDGVRATCFICADGIAPRCVQRASALAPQVVFYPNNRGGFLLEYAQIDELAKTVSAPVLVTNRTGSSWGHDCRGGCAVYAATGEALAKSKNEGVEEILVHDLEIATSRVATSIDV